jgi:branched-chain amino acid transport system substrate-binding protein
VLFPDDVYGADALETTKDVLAKALAIPETNEAKYKADGSDLAEKARSLLADKPAATKPEAVLVWALPAQATRAAQAIKDTGWTGKVYFDSAAVGGLFLNNPATEGATIVFPQTLAMDDVVATTPAKAARKQWFEEYTARYGAYHGQASFAADALEVVVSSVQRVGTNRSALQGALETTEIDGLSGPLRMTPANHSGLMPQALEVFVALGGRWRLLG